MRAHVAESWQRSAAAGVDAETVQAPITLPQDALRDHRQDHVLARVFPLLDDVLGQAARDCDAIMAVSDQSGQLLWVCGSPATLRRAEAIGFVEGSNWDERLAGTNAPGMALALDRPISVLGTEHFRRSVRGWSCIATPIHDPRSHALLGVLDVTGGEGIVVPQTMAMVRAAARMAEAELARDLLGPRTFEPAPSAGLRMSVLALGRAEAMVQISAGARPATALRLSPRHSEILLLLAIAPNGLSGDELVVSLYEDDPSPSTLRAELNRLRQILGDSILASRPYRLTAEVTGDWYAVEAHLAAGELVEALHVYRGPLLPRSSAPGVVRLRESVEQAMRLAIRRSGQADLMSAWTRSSWGADDYEMWQAQAEVTDRRSPLLALIEGQLARLDLEYGVTRPGR